MLPRKTWSGLLAFLLVSSTSCAPIGFGEQELTLRHDAKADALDLLIVYDAIQATSPEQDAAKKGREFATRVSGGQRLFMIYDWPMIFDLDRMLGEAHEPADGESDPWRDWELEVIRNLGSVKVENSGYFSDETARPGLYQHLHMGVVARWLSLFERALYIGIEESLAKDRFVEDFSLLDARTRELWIAMAKEKKSWLSLKDGVLTVDLPATGACATRILIEILNESSKSESSARSISGLASHLTDMKIADEHVVLRWKLDGTTFTFDPPKDHEYDGSLAQSLRDSKALPETMPSRREVVEKFSKH